jgi:cytochrome c-type biogenesis protein CcmH
MSALLSLALLFGAGSALAEDTEHTPVKDYPADLQGYVPGASELEGQIRAPCCWNQTLDIHGSEISQALKREIRTRLRAGDSVDTIRSDIVSRYGEKVLAVPPGNPLKDVAVLLVLAVAVSGALAFVFVNRWRRRSAENAPASTTAQSTQRDRWDDRLDNELDQLER